jgi:lipoate-protein ligase A
MSSLSCRLLPFVVADGPHNMAADEVLLEAALAGTASLRFYGWSVPTLSLGYFQAEQLLDAEPELARLPRVRRPSGGMTLVHDQELTYALALPAGPTWQPKSQPWLCRMHGIIAAALATQGIAVQAARCGQEVEAESPLCFLHHTPGDLLLESAKVVGSAQRRRQGALLQHGAILLAESRFTPQLPGLLERAGQRPALETLMTALREEWERQTGWLLLPGHWTAAEREQQQVLVASRYTSSHWTSKR